MNEGDIKDFWCRQDNDSVSVDDVDAFGKEQEIIFSKSKANSVFSRQEWDEYVCAHVRCTANGRPP